MFANESTFFIERKQHPPSGKKDSKEDIEPIFEADVSPHSYGFRPTRSAHSAVDDIARTQRAGYTRVIDADLSKYFDSVPQSKPMAVMTERLVDGGILHLIQQWLKHLLSKKTRMA